MDKEEMYQRVEEFFLNFEEDGEKKYISRLQKIAEGETKSIVIDFKDFVNYDDVLANELISSYDEVSEVISDIAIKLLKTFYGFEVNRIFVRVRNLNKTLRLKDLTEEHVNKLVQIEGIISSASDTHYFAEVVPYVCLECGFSTKVRNNILEEEIKIPKCPSCGSRKIEPVKNKIQFVTYRRLEIQELPERASVSGISSIEAVVVGDDIVNKIEAGDRVIVTGVVRPRKIKGTKYAYYEKVLEISDIKVESQKFTDVVVTPEEERQIREIASRDDAFDVVVNSIAPSIKGQYHVKRAIAVALFSGGYMESPEGIPIRAESHVLLVGDPGTAKSQIREFLRKVIPRGIVTSAATSTGVGLVGATVRDPVTGEWTVKAGALPKSDGGIAFIDEFAEMPGRERSAIREALEQGVVSISKGGVTITLPAKATVIAAMNPKHGRWNLDERLFDQIDLDSPLLSRFDLIVPVIDEPDEKMDYEIAKHILSFMISGKKGKIKYIEPELLKKYIAYARQNINPRLSDDAIEYLAKYYSTMRKKSRKYNGFYEMPLGPRQLMAFYRIARSIARIYLREVITVDDIKKAIEIWEENMKVLFENGDEESAEFIDINNIEVGSSGRTLSKIEKIIKIIKALEPEYPEGIPGKVIIEEAVKQGIDKYDAQRLLRKLYERGDIYEVSYNKFALSP